MTDNNQHDAEVRQFLLDQIDSVPHLEALLLLWNSRPNCGRPTKWLAACMWTARLQPGSCKTWRDSS